MKVAIKCPDCGKSFTIDHKASDREIERLKAEISRLQGVESIGNIHENAPASV